MDKKEFIEYLEQEHERIVRETVNAYPKKGGKFEESKRVSVDTANSIFAELKNEVLVDELFACVSDADIEKRIQMVRKEGHTKIYDAVRETGRQKVGSVVWKNMQTTFDTIRTELKKRLAEIRIQQEDNIKQVNEVSPHVEEKRMINIEHLQNFLLLGLSQKILKSDIAIMLHESCENEVLSTEDDALMEYMIGMFIARRMADTYKVLRKYSSGAYTHEELQHIVDIYVQQMGSYDDLKENSCNSKKTERFDEVFRKLNKHIAKEMRDWCQIFLIHDDFMQLIDFHQSIGLKQMQYNIVEDIHMLRAMHFEHRLFDQEKKCIEEWNGDTTELVRELNTKFHGGWTVWTSKKLAQYTAEKNEEEKDVNANVGDITGESKESVVKEVESYEQHDIEDTQESHGEIDVLSIPDIPRDCCEKHIKEDTAYFEWLHDPEKTVTKEQLLMFTKGAVAKMFGVDCAPSNFEKNWEPIQMYPITKEEYTKIYRLYIQIEKCVNMTSKELSYTKGKEHIDQQQAYKFIDTLEKRMRQYIGGDQEVGDRIDVILQRIYLFIDLLYQQNIEKYADSKTFRSDVVLFHAPMWGAKGKAIYWEAIRDIVQRTVESRRVKGEDSLKDLRKRENTMIATHSLLQTEVDGILRTLIQKERRHVFQKIQQDINDTLHGGLDVMLIDTIEKIYDMLIYHQEERKKKEEKNQIQEEVHVEVEKLVHSEKQSVDAILEDTNICIVPKTDQENSHQTIFEKEFQEPKEMSQEVKDSIVHTIKEHPALVNFQMERIHVQSGYHMLPERLGIEFQEVLLSCIAHPTPEVVKDILRIVICKYALGQCLAATSSLNYMNYGTITFEYAYCLTDNVLLTGVLPIVDYTTIKEQFLYVEKECERLFVAKKDEKVWTVDKYFSLMQELEQCIISIPELRGIKKDFCDDLYDSLCIVLQVGRDAWKNKEDVVIATLALAAPINYKLLKKQRYGMYMPIVIKKFEEFYTSYLTQKSVITKKVLDVECEALQHIGTTPEEKEIFREGNRKKMKKLFIELSTLVNNYVYLGLPVRDCEKEYDAVLRALQSPKSSRNISRFGQAVYEYIEEQKSMVDIDHAHQKVEDTESAVEEEFQLIDLDTVDDVETKHAHEVQIREYTQRIQVLEKELNVLQEQELKAQEKISKILKEKNTEKSQLLMLEQKLEKQEMLVRKLEEENERLHAKWKVRPLPPLTIQRAKNMYAHIKNTRKKLYMQSEESIRQLQNVIIPLHRFAEREQLTVEEFSVLQEMWEYFYRTLDIRTLEGVMEIADKALVFHNWNLAEVESVEKLSRAWKKYFTNTEISDVFEKMKQFSELHGLTHEEWAEMLHVWKEWKKNVDEHTGYGPEQTSDVTSIEDKKVDEKYKIYEEILIKSYEEVTSFVSSQIQDIDTKFQAYCEKYDIEDASLPTYMQFVNTLPSYVMKGNFHKTELFKKLLRALDKFEKFLEENAVQIEGRNRPYKLIFGKIMMDVRRGKDIRFDKEKIVLMQKILHYTNVFREME